MNPFLLVVFLVLGCGFLLVLCPKLYQFFDNKSYEKYLKERAKLNVARWQERM